MRLDYERARLYLEDLLQQQMELHYDHEHDKLQWSDERGEWEFSFPLIFPPRVASLDLGDYISQVPEVPPNYIIVLIRSGSASLGFFIDGELAVHKVIRKYMVRKTRGKAQLSYLKSKGKSRAGSRIRLRESLEFFEEINSKLTDWSEAPEPIDYVFYSCPISLQSHWYSSQVPPPFEKNNKKLIHLPFHIFQPDHDELLRVDRLVTTALLVPLDPVGGF